MRYASGNNKPKQGASDMVVEPVGSKANRVDNIEVYQKIAKPVHQYKYLWKKCTEEKTIINAWYRFRKGKTNRPDVKMIESNFSHYVWQMRQMLFATRPIKDGGDINKMFTPRYHEPVFITEHSKTRETYHPDTWEQWIHHIVIYVLEPILMKHFHKNTCGSLPKRGGIYGKRIIERTIKRSGFKYYLKGDVRHFFKHAKVDKLIEKLKCFISDEWFLFLIKRMYLHYDWLVLGFYPSQWFANFILSPFDWFVSRKRQILYLRYVDDFIVCSNNKRELHRILGEIKHFLGKQYHLRLKNNYQITKMHYKNNGRPIDIMGFVFKRHKTILRKTIMLRATKMAKRLSKKSIISVGQARSMLSRTGWFLHTNSEICWYTYIEPFISVSSLKQIVSRHDRRSRDGQMGNSKTWAVS